VWERCVHEGYVGYVCVRSVFVCVSDKGDEEGVGLCFCAVYM